KGKDYRYLVRGSRQRVFGELAQYVERWICDNITMHAMVFKEVLRRGIPAAVGDIAAVGCMAGAVSRQDDPAEPTSRIIDRTYKFFFLEQPFRYPLRFHEVLVGSGVRFGVG